MAFKPKSAAETKAADFAPTVAPTVARSAPSVAPRATRLDRAARRQASRPRD